MEEPPTTPLNGTKKQIIDLAESLLLQRGYNGFSYSHISAALNVKNAAIHYHFPTKTELGVAIIQRTRQQFEKWTNNSRIDNMSYLKKLDAFFDIFRNFLKFEGPVCLGSALENDFNTLPGEMQQETRAFIADFLTWLEKLLKEGRDTGEFSFSGPPKEQAVFVLAALQGASQMVRATDKTYLDMAIRQIKQSLKRE
ncbi:MAG: TetR/AcrR family transcriptional regulator [Deltaproteobacteria bacterium HGW-Deltaproteobacteria-12]|jgi:AcrR family transcriptional regulator|nr:MAG: TetR/AcrR family transcriptional regulator [Deltaproteobacteria bacterium HGW-Deltaproteobacteria-12]